MAGSRAFKIGTIYSRTSGLIKSGARNWAERPLWYDIYEAFPPKVQPEFSRAEPTEEIKPIFYVEDYLRANFYKKYGNVGLINLSDTSRPTICQLFIEEYSKLKENSALSEEQLWTEAATILENRGFRLTRAKPEAKKMDPSVSADFYSQIISEANEAGEEDAVAAAAAEIEEDPSKRNIDSEKVEAFMDDLFSKDDK